MIHPVICFRSCISERRFLDDSLVNSRKISEHVRKLVVVVVVAAASVCVCKMRNRAHETKVVGICAR